MDFTIGFIQHNFKLYTRYLGRSLSSLEGRFITAGVPSNELPAKNYNILKDLCNTPYLILTHEDMTFPSDTLHRIKQTIDSLQDISWGVLGMVGRDFNSNYIYSKETCIQEVDTLDACFIVIKQDDSLFFNDTVFNDYHLYVEDYCAQHNRFMQNKNFTIMINADEISEYPRNPDPFLTPMRHHSATVNELGTCWGNYMHYRNLLEQRWPGIKTT